MTSQTTATPYVGMPATIHLYTDTIPAVVVGVTAKSVVVQQVDIDEVSKMTYDDGSGFPVITYNGNVDAPIGERERFTLTKNGTYRRGSIGLQLGKSYKRTDYRF